MPCEVAMSCFVQIGLLFLAILFQVHGNELSRCCSGGARHYRETQTCTGVKAVGTSITCVRTAKICCIRALLDMSCNYGRDLADKDLQCFIDIHEIAGAECCDCCALALEQKSQDEKCVAPVGFSSSCLNSFNKCSILNPSKSLVMKGCEQEKCDHFCNDRTDGTSECTCRPGYNLAADGRTCVDRDECSMQAATIFCDLKREICVNKEGGYGCRPIGATNNYKSIPALKNENCSIGFTIGPSGNCVDLDECLMLLDNCLESQRCLNTPGSFKCIRTLSCGTGYALDSNTEQCKDVDECNLGAHDCGQMYQCRNTPGSFRCDPKRCSLTEIMDPITGECTSAQCPPGYTAKTNGICEDIDECATNNRCNQFDECINIPGSFRCQEKGNLCPHGFQMDRDSGFCVDVDECSQNLHTCGQLQCINLIGSYKCRCIAGYEFNETSKYCEDVDECVKFAGHTCSPHATCENTIGSFLCHCNSGYQLAKDGRNCEDLDECVSGLAKCQQKCVNTPGSYQCICDRGYQLGIDELTCEDINECSIWAKSGNYSTSLLIFKGNDLCMGTCINTLGSYRCICPIGYEVLTDGITCKDIDECSEGACHGKDRLCVNTLGGYRCLEMECPRNYITDRNNKNRCVRKPHFCENLGREKCKKLAMHISWQHIAIPKQINISQQRTSVTLFSMKGPSNPNSTMQFELNMIKSKTEFYNKNITLAVRENFLLQKGEEHNSAIIALRDSLDGPQEVQLELILRLHTNGVYTAKFIANLVIYVSEFKPQIQYRNNAVERSTQFRKRYS